MDVTSRERGFFSVVRWRSDATRDEARNVAVVLVDAEGQFGGIRMAPPSALSSDARQQGFLDAMLHGLERQFEGPDRPDLGRLHALSESLAHSLYITTPRPTAVPDPELTLQALYRAYVAPLPSGLNVHRSEYVDDILFDALVERTVGGPLACDILSFAAPKQDWVPAERDAGHFLFGLGRLHLAGMAVIQPPTVDSRPEAHTSFERVRRWFEQASVPVREPDELAQSQLHLSIQ